MTADNTDRKRPGRPTGSSDTRERILDHARELFSRNGFDKTSIRAIAAAAGVDGSNIASDRLALLPIDPDGSEVTAPQSTCCTVMTT